MNQLAQHLRDFGAEDSALHAFDADGPELLPYATLITARSSGNKDLVAIEGVYEWQNAPLLFLISAQSVDGNPQLLLRVRRLLAMRGDAPYLGVVAQGRLDVYRISLDACAPNDAKVSIGIPADQKIATIAHLGNVRPDAATGTKQWISQVVLKLLSSSIDRLKAVCKVGDDDAISLVGRALFTRFLGDRGLLTPLNANPDNWSKLFDTASQARMTSDWLDTTFNGDFLPLTDGLFGRLPKSAFGILGDISRRAPDGQLFLGWEERWDNLDFNHIPVGVLSQAYEHYLRNHAPVRQRKEGGYYTPRPIAELMVRGAFHALARDGNAYKAKVLDPAAGAGVFLLTVFRQLVAEKWRYDGVRPDTANLRDILYSQIAGFDINEAALRFAALGLYLISIELDPQPEPVKKLRFKKLRGRVLFKLGDDASASRGLGSLGPEVGAKHRGRYDLVIGNPPWASGTQLPKWNELETILHEIARGRVENAATPTIPNEVLDLPFVWRAMDWAKPDGQIAFALHARLLFQQGDGMADARKELFTTLDITAIVNGADLRHTRVWPEITAPFCLLYARNRVPSSGSGFRFVSPHLEQSLNSAGGMRIDAVNSNVVTVDQIVETPEILKILFRGGEEDFEIYRRLKTYEFPSLNAFWKSVFGVDGNRPKFTGNGYQRLRASSRIRKDGDGKPGVPASYLRNLPEISLDALDSLLINTERLPKFALKRIHDPRSRALFQAPLLLIHKSPPAGTGRIGVAVCEADAVFNETFYGYSAKSHPAGKELVRYLSLVLGSKPALWLALITSGEFGFEREVIEKATIDKIPIPPFDALTPDNRKVVNRLFKSAIGNADSAWREIDAFVASLYKLKPRELQTISDTLRFNLPFSVNRKDAQAAPSEKAIRRFCDVLTKELAPWGKRFDRPLVAKPAQRLMGSPWRSIQLAGLNAAEEPDTNIADWPHILQVADQTAATELTYLDASEDHLWLARLEQQRYWSDSKARQTAKNLVWTHVEFLKGLRS